MQPVQTVWDWWAEQEEGGRRNRTEEAARVRDEQIQALRETAIEGLAGASLGDLDDTEPRGRGGVIDARLLPPDVLRLS